MVSSKIPPEELAKREKLAQKQALAIRIASLEDRIRHIRYVKNILIAEEQSTAQILDHLRQEGGP